jgi:tRNA(adenine34) deaminase
MWESLSLAWQTCFEEAWAAYCVGTVPIGAAVTDANRVVLSRGRNRINDHEGGGVYLYGQTLAHAEINTLVALGVHGTERHKCILYTTVEPCPLCIGALYMSGVRELHYASRDPFAGSVNLLGKTPYLSRKAIKVISPERVDFEIVNISLTVEFNLSLKGERIDNAVIEAWEEVIPRGVDLGRQLFRSGELREMKEANSTAKEVLEWLEAKI